MRYNQHFTSIGIPLSNAIVGARDFLVGVLLYMTQITTPIPTPIPTLTKLQFKQQLQQCQHSQKETVTQAYIFDIQRVSKNLVFDGDWRSPMYDCSNRALPKLSSRSD